MSKAQEFLLFGPMKFHHKIMALIVKDAQQPRMSKERAAKFVAWTKLLLRFLEHPEEFGHKRGERVKIDLTVKL